MAPYHVMGTLLSCGWHVGPAAAEGFDVRVRPGAGGASVEPGLEVAAEDAVRLGLRRRGVPDGGSLLVIDAFYVEHRPHGALALGTVGWETTLEMGASVGDCRVSARAQRAWTAPPGGPDGMEDRREAVVGALVEEAADRLVDEAISGIRCR